MIDILDYVLPGAVFDPEIIQMLASAFDDAWDRIEKSGEAHEVKGYDALMELHDINPGRLLGDKGYDSDDIRNDLADRGIEPVIPPRSNRKTPIEYDREAYKRRNLIERCVNRLKQFRRIATRYEKTARAYLSMLCIAAARLWIKTVNTA